VRVPSGCCILGQLTTNTADTPALIASLYASIGEKGLVVGYLTLGNHEGVIITLLANALLEYLEHDVPIGIAIRCCLASD
jgi:hypothetical protein